MPGKLMAGAIGTFWLVLGGCASAVLAAGLPELASGSWVWRWPLAWPS